MSTYEVYGPPLVAFGPDVDSHVIANLLQPLERGGWVVTVEHTYGINEGAVQRAGETELELAVPDPDGFVETVTCGIEWHDIERIIIH